MVDFNNTTILSIYKELSYGKAWKITTTSVSGINYGDPSDFKLEKKSVIICDKECIKDFKQ